MRVTGEEIQGHGQTYRLLRRIGQGGFGDVYLARATTQGGLTRTVAIKLLKDKAGPDSDTAKRLRDEARVLGLMDHRNIVRAEDLIEVQGRPALVMEFVPGANLDWLIDPRSNPSPLPPDVLLDILQQVADALDTAWQRPSHLTGKPLGVLHRDIKPSNIRITPEGDVKVLDFGISKPEGMEREAHTRRGPPGSRYYAPPEMFMGLPQGPTVDVYALGATAYECLTRKQLGMAQDRAASHALHVEKKLESLDLLDWQDAATPMRQLLSQMLSFDSGERPSAKEVRSRCQEFRAGLPGLGLEHWAPRVVPHVVAIHAREEDGPLTGIEVRSQRMLDSEAETVTVRSRKADVKRAPEPTVPSNPQPLQPPSAAGSQVPRWQTAIVLSAILVLAGVVIGALLRTGPAPPAGIPAAPPVPAAVAPIVETAPAPPSPPAAAKTVRSRPKSAPDPVPEPVPVEADNEPVEVVFTSTPLSISVSLDDVPLGITPLRMSLVPGTYSLQFQGEQPVTERIEVTADGRTRWAFHSPSGSIR
jgi:serine/threonine-protein kinase